MGFTPELRPYAEVPYFMAAAVIAAMYWSQIKQFAREAITPTAIGLLLLNAGCIRPYDVPEFQEIETGSSPE